MPSSSPTRTIIFSSSIRRRSACSEKVQRQVPVNEWSQHYGLYLPDKVTPFPHDQLPITRSIRGEEVDNIEMFVRNEKVATGNLDPNHWSSIACANGDLLGGVIVCRDITKSKRKNFSVLAKVEFWK